MKLEKDGLEIGLTWVALTCICILIWIWGIIPAICAVGDWLAAL